MLGLLGWGAYSILGNAGGGKEIEVPNLVGMDVDTAKSTLEKLNLVLVEAGEETSDQYPEGTVMEMNPKAGDKVKEKGEVRVIVSGGENKLKMPDIREYDLDKAGEILSSYGLKITNKTDEYSDSVASGEIISQTPTKDTEITKDQEISVVVSKGPKIKYATVPNVVGLSEEKAKSRLANNGLNVSVTTEEVSDKSKDGIVSSQTSEGDTVKQGATITITVGKYVEKETTVTPEPNPGTGNTNNGSSNNTNNSGNTNNGNNHNNSSNGNTNSSQTQPGGSNTSGPNSGNTENKEPQGPWDDVNNQANSQSNKTPSGN